MRSRTFVKSTRLQHWDYTSDAWYFVTICTRDRRSTLGQVIDGEMQMSSAGRIVLEEWPRTEEVRGNVCLDEFVVMPNHIHGIVIIEESPLQTQASASHRDASTGRPRLYANSLGSIVAQFKSVATKRIWDAGFPDFAWQPRFYDHIIRSAESLDAIRRYIRDNPAKWALDKDNLEGLRM
jgi:REP element-mobilizing transposase RayT